MIGVDNQLVRVEGVAVVYVRCHKFRYTKIHMCKAKAKTQVGHYRAISLTYNTCLLFSSRDVVAFSVA